MRTFLAASFLLALVTPASAQEKAAGSPLKYEINATLTDYCPVEKTISLHPVLFDFHNDSCQNPKHVAERKTPTLPNGRLYSNISISGYQLIDWSEGHPSPNSRNQAKVEITKTTTTLSASGSLGRASCTKEASGKVVVEDSYWQARVVPEVQLLEAEQRPQPPITAEVVPPQTAAVLTLSAGCPGDRQPSLQYSVTPFVNGVAQSSIYTSPLLTAGKTATESNATLSSALIHASWTPQTSGQSELTVTISAAGKQEPALSH